MRTVLLILFLAVSVPAISQNDSLNPTKTDSVSLRQQLDSANLFLEDLKQKDWEERNLSGINYLLAQQKENKARQKNQALIRIGIGVFFLVILIIGLRRRSKQSVS